MEEIIKNKNLNNEKNNYNAIDAYKIFLYTMMMIAFASVIAVVLVYLFFIISGAGDWDTFCDSQFINYFLATFSSIIFLAIYLIYNKTKKYKAISASKINFKLDWKIIIICIVVAFVVLFLISPLINALDYLFSFIGYNPKGELDYIIDNGWRLFLAIIGMAVLPAICEELIFRGIIFNGLLTKYKPATAIVVSGALFALMHTSLQQTFYQFILGVVIALIVYFGGSLIYGMIVHFANNCIVLVVGYITTNTSQEVSIDWAFIINMILCLILAVLIIYLLVKYIISINKKRKYNFKNQVINYNIYELSTIRLYAVLGIFIGVVLWIINTASGFKI